MVQTITTVEGRAVPMRGADIDTDRIIPGRFLRTVTFENLEQHVFEDDRKAGGHPFDDRRYAGASILLTNTNFGCGSSREYAPEALKRRGIGAIVAPSFARIFFRNAINLGIPLVAAADVAAALEDGDEVVLDYEGRTLVSPRGLFVLPDPPAFVDEIVRAGGIVAYVREHGRFPGEGD